MYNKKVYEKLGLTVPKTWDEFISNSEKIKAAGITPVLVSYGDTWTSQLFVLADFANVSAQDSKWADQYTANKREVREPAGARRLHAHAGDLRQGADEQGLRVADQRQRAEGARHRCRRPVPDDHRGDRQRGAVQPGAGQRHRLLRDADRQRRPARDGLGAERRLHPEDDDR